MLYQNVKLDGVRRVDFEHGASCHRPSLGVAVSSGTKAARPSAEMSLSGKDEVPWARQDEILGCLLL